MLQSLKRSNRTVVISSIWVFYLYLKEDDDRCREIRCQLEFTRTIVIAVVAFFGKYLQFHYLAIWIITHPFWLIIVQYIVRSSNALHLWIRLTLYQRIFLPVDVTEPWSRLFFNHWFWFCQFLSDVNSFCFRCCCHGFLRSLAYESFRALFLSSESLSSARKI